MAYHILILMSIYGTVLQIKVPERIVAVTILYVKTIVAIVLGFFAGLGVVYIFNRMPARWLCDYGETPSPELMDRSIQRIKGWPWRWIYAGGLACLCVRLMWTKIHHPPAGFDGLPMETVQLISQCQLTLAGLAVCWALLIIGLADLKYMIIPDQFVILLAIAGLGFAPLQANLWQPLGGLAIGGGVMLIVALLGRVCFGKEVMGFGDVKLCAALGLALGINGIMFTLAVASLVSGFVCAVGLARRKYKKDDLKPLGPYLAGAGIFYVFIILPFMI